MQIVVCYYILTLKGGGANFSNNDFVMKGGDKLVITKEDENVYV